MDVVDVVEKHSLISYLVLTQEGKIILSHHYHHFRLRVLVEK